MPRPAAGALALLAAAATGLIMISPAAAQAHAHAPAARTHVTAGARPDGEIEWFSGYTYPDTAAGLAACNAEGTYERAHGVSSYSCWLGNPDAGRYGLWLLDIIRN